jgi:Tol biopolymer transport system component
MSRRLCSAVAVVAAAVAGLGLSASAQATFPGVNGRIAFVRGADIYTMRPDGQGVRRLTRLGGGVNAFFQSWSPDGRLIVFNKFFRDTPPQLWVMAADGSRQRLLLAERDFAEQAPRFSPDGQSIVFARCPANPFAPCAIWRMKADGTNLRPLTPFDQEVFDFHPNFSPDGTSVAFTSLSREGVINGAYVMAADGTGVRPITPPELQACCPDWAPDGRRLAFHSHAPSGTDPRHAAIWLVRPDGTRLMRVTHPGARSDVDPSWSPQGDAIAFQRFSPDRSSSSVHVIRPDGRGLRKIQDDAQQPRWGARP